MTHSWSPASLKSTSKRGWREIDIWTGKNKVISLSPDPRMSCCWGLHTRARTHTHRESHTHTHAMNYLSISNIPQHFTNFDPSKTTSVWSEILTIQTHSHAQCAPQGQRWEGESAMKDAVDAAEGWVRGIEEVGRWLSADRLYKRLQCVAFSFRIISIHANRHRNVHKCTHAVFNLTFFLSFF